MILKKSKKALKIPKTPKLKKTLKIVKKSIKLKEPEPKPVINTPTKKNTKKRISAHYLCKEMGGDGKSLTR